MLVLINRCISDFNPIPLFLTECFTQCNVNYLRSAIGQSSLGHISPLAAYDKEGDRFLILDVSRYKYPPVWVEAAALFAAMNTTDKGNENRTRGYVIVGR
jgi:glutathione-S-conjugate glycine hydrolase